MSDNTDELCALLKTLNSALDDEFSALRSRDPAVLVDAVTQKTELLVKLEEVSAACMVDGELPSTPELDELLHQCAERNRINGGAIAVSRSLTSGLLNTLLGGTAKSQVYTAGGEIGHSSNRREVGYV